MKRWTKVSKELCHWLSQVKDVRVLLRQANYQSLYKSGSPDSQSKARQSHVKLALLRGNSMRINSLNLIYIEEVGVYILEDIILNQKKILMTWDFT